MCGDVEQKFNKKRTEQRLDNYRLGCLLSKEYHPKYENEICMNNNMLMCKYFLF